MSLFLRGKVKQKPRSCVITYFFQHKPKKVRVAYLERVGWEWRQGLEGNQGKEHNWVNQKLKGSFGKLGPIPNSAASLLGDFIKANYFTLSFGFFVYKLQTLSCIHLFRFIDGKSITIILIIFSHKTLIAAMRQLMPVDKLMSSSYLPLTAKHRDTQTRWNKYPLSKL